METKHSIGPWKVGAMTTSGQTIVRNASGGMVCMLESVYQSMRDADAALIAQAPDLLAERDRLLQVNAELVAALEDASFLLAKIGKFPGDLPQFMGSIIRSVQDARAALEKSKGE